jgi:hypothetical protein
MEACDSTVVRIVEIAENGNYIRLENSSVSGKTEYLGCNVLYQSVNGCVVRSYQFPPRVSLSPGQELRVWAGPAAVRHPTSCGSGDCCHGNSCVCLDLCYPELINWDCERCTTVLARANGQILTTLPASTALLCNPGGKVIKYGITRYGNDTTMTPGQPVLEDYVRCIQSVNKWTPRLTPNCFYHSLVDDCPHD